MTQTTIPTEPVPAPILPPPVRQYRPLMPLTRKVAYWCAAIAALQAAFAVFVIPPEEIRHGADLLNFIIALVLGALLTFAVLFVLVLAAIAARRGAVAFLRWINRRPAP